MHRDLRPLTLGEILDHTAQLYRSHFLLFAGISAIYSGLLLAMSLLEIGLETVLRSMHLAQAVLWTAWTSTGLSLLLAFIAAGTAIAANNRAVGWLSLGMPATIRSAYASILPRLGRYLWLMAITAVLVWLPLALLYGGYLAFIFANVRPGGIIGQPGVAPQATMGLVIASGIFGLLLIPAGVYTILMALRYALAVPACVMEDLKARQAIRRSVSLSKGTRGRLFVLGLLAITIQLGLLLLTQSFFVITEMRHHGEASPGLRVMQQIVAFFTNTFVGPIYATGLTLFYFDQRVRKEGYDIERMMEAAGFIPGPAEPLQTTRETEA